MKLLKQRVLIKPTPVDTVSPGGIHIPAEQSEDHYNTHRGEGVVVLLGAGVNDCKVGDTVIYGRHDGSEMQFKGDVCHQINEHELLAVVG